MTQKRRCGRGLILLRLNSQQPAPILRAGVFSLENGGSPRGRHAATEDSASMGHGGRGVKEWGVGAGVVFFFPF